MLHANRRTDGRTDVTTVISASRDCAKAPEIISKRIKLQEVGGGRGDWMETSGKVYWLASQEGPCSME